LYLAKLADNAPFGDFIHHVDLLSGAAFLSAVTSTGFGHNFGMVIANLCIATLLGS